MVVVPAVLMLVIGLVRPEWGWGGQWRMETQEKKYKDDCQAGLDEDIKQHRHSTYYSSFNAYSFHFDTRPISNSKDLTTFNINNNYANNPRNGSHS